MASLEKTLRNQLERAVKEARDVAEAGAKAALETLGVGDAGPPSHLDDDQRNLRRRLRIHGRQLGDLPEEKKKTQEIERLIEEVAYEHWHRMLFARFLAENNLLMYPDPHSPVAVSLAECEDLAADEGARNGWELAARFAARMLPQIFRVDSPVFELELPPERQQQLEKLISDLPAGVFTASDSLGWVYQFWQARRKEQVNDAGNKIGARELPSVTQLFTEDYMVDFLLDNTLGAWHAGKALAVNRSLATTAQNEDELRDAVALPGCPWAYLRFVQSEDRNWTPAAGTFEGWPKTANELKCLDPCMGSGHFVVAMFERLVALRMAEEKLDEAAAVVTVIRDNLFGLEIDPRCTQIAAFNVALAAWRRVGHCLLPSLNMACSGVAPNTSEEEWLKLAGGNEKLENGMASLYQLFENAPVLGSLINPRAGEGDLLVAAFHELQPLLEKALAQETKDDTAHEMAVTASGLARAAEILAGQFTLVATNVPYLGFHKQDGILSDYCKRVYADAKADLATCFAERSLAFCSRGCSVALVKPQNVLFLKTYTAFRNKQLAHTRCQMFVKLGAKAFNTPMWDFGVSLDVVTNSVPESNSLLAGVDVGMHTDPEAKSIALKKDVLFVGRQLEQLKNPDAAIVFFEASDLDPLSKYADSLTGAHTLDIERFRLNFWEIEYVTKKWNLHASTPVAGKPFSGMQYISYTRAQGDAFAELAAAMKEEGFLGGWLSGNKAWGKVGVACSWMGQLPAGFYLGQIYDNSIAAIIPRDPLHLPAIYCYCSSPQYLEEVRKINQKTQVANATLVKVPFDLAHWQKVAAEKYPDGLPKPFSSDPTQWLFNGHPHGSDNPLHVAVTRLVGYQWPRQTGSRFPDCPALGPDGLEAFADKDGIVCIPPVRGESSAADRLLNLLATAYGNEWSSDVLSRLLSDADYAGKSLEAWLRDGFFQQHCELFHQRPFVWHIWDGLRDGFSALVNYHKLDRKNLETLIYTYLGDWITRCEAQDKDSGLTEDGEKTTAAKNLKRKLELILAGESPYDIFVRWKPLHQQPIGWEPDINDGVRMNIRPFVSVPDVKAKGAGILRVKPKIKWEKDRGKEPQRSKEDYPWFWGWDGKTTDFAGVGTEPTGERFNDCHYTLATKQKARSKAGGT
jgi:hypothetical protein